MQQKPLPKSRRSNVTRGSARASVVAASVRVWRISSRICPRSIVETRQGTTGATSSLGENFVVIPDEPLCGRRKQTASTRHEAGGFAWPDVGGVIGVETETSPSVYAGQAWRPTPRTIIAQPSYRLRAASFSKLRHEGGVARTRPVCRARPHRHGTGQFGERGVQLGEAPYPLREASQPPLLERGDVGWR